MLEIEGGEEEGKWCEKNGVRGICEDHCGASHLFTSLNNLPLMALTKSYETMHEPNSLETVGEEFAFCPVLN